MRHPNVYPWSAAVSMLGLLPGTPLLLLVYGTYTRWPRGDGIPLLGHPYVYPLTWCSDLVNQVSRQHHHLVMLAEILGSTDLRVSCLVASPLTKHSR